MFDKIINVYIDMDGVQTVYNKDDLVDDMKKPGYFISRQPHEQVLDFIRALDEDPRFSVTVLSAVFCDAHSVFEKATWLYTNGISDVNCMFVPCETKKCDYVDGSQMNVLIDDYSKNLIEWEAAGENFRGIKFLNEANGINGTWNARGGATLHYQMSADELYHELVRIVDIRLAA